MDGQEENFYNQKRAAGVAAQKRNGMCDVYSIIVTLFIVIVVITHFTMTPIDLLNF